MCRWGMCRPKDEVSCTSPGSDDDPNSIRPASRTGNGATAMSPDRDRGDGGLYYRAVLQPGSILSLVSARVCFLDWDRLGVPRDCHGAPLVGRGLGTGHPPP